MPVRICHGVTGNVATVAEWIGRRLVAVVEESRVTA
jgi:hypothetical protein